MWWNNRATRKACRNEKFCKKDRTMVRKMTMMKMKKDWWVTMVLDMQTLLLVYALFVIWRSVGQRVLVAIPSASNKHSPAIMVIFYVSVAFNGLQFAQVRKNQCSSYLFIYFVNYFSRPFSSKSLIRSEFQCSACNKNLGKKSSLSKMSLTLILHINNVEVVKNLLK